jgi:hypothetical protein
MGLLEISIRISKSAEKITLAVGMVKKLYVAADNYCATGTLAQVLMARSVHCAFPHGKKHSGFKSLPRH